MNGLLADSFCLGNFIFIHVQKVVGIDVLGLLFRQLANSSVKLLVIQLPFVKLVRRCCSKQHAIFNTISTVQRVVCLMPISTELISSLIQIELVKLPRKLVRNFNEIVGCILIGIEIPKVDCLHKNISISYQNELK